jgi:RNA polymerase sigma-70 factor (ECF subfamily)
MVSIDEALPLPSRAYSQSDAFLRDPEQQMSTRQGCIILSREIALIPPIFRNILILRELREIPLREIASQLKLTVPTVKSRLFRGRKELRARLLKCCGARDLLAS